MKASRRLGQAHQGLLQALGRKLASRRRFNIADDEDIISPEQKTAEVMHERRAKDVYGPSNGPARADIPARCRWSLLPKIC